MEHLLSWNVFLLIVSSLIGHCYSNPVPNDASKVYQKFESQPNDVLIEPTNQLPSFSASPVNKLIQTVPQNLHREVVQLLSPSKAFASHGNSVKTEIKKQDDSPKNPLINRIQILGSTVGIERSSSAQGTENLASRLRRSLGYHRSRCCYMDVMCSSGCRSHRYRRFKLEDQSLTDFLKRDEHNLPQTGDSQERALASRRRGYKKRRLLQNFLFKHLAKELHHLQKATAKNKIAPDEFSTSVEENVNISQMARKFHLGNNAKFKSTIGMIMQMTENTNSELNIMHSLPRVLDSLEYIMNKQK